MNENENPNPIDIQPLKKLVNLTKGQKPVQIPYDLLPRIDLSILNRKLQFDLPHNLRVRVIIEREKEPSRIWSDISVETEWSDWPNNDLRHLYSTALGVAAEKIIDEESPVKSARR